VNAPGIWTLEGFFEGRPKSLRLFCLMRKYLETLGPVEVEVMKTQVSFAAGRKFAWVWLPQMWVKRTEASITLTFDLPRHIEHPRIEKAVEPRAGFWTHHVIVEKEADLDGDVRGWLAEAYVFARERVRPRSG
jgi:hypothetical protein